MTFLSRVGIFLILVILWFDFNPAGFCVYLEILLFSRIGFCGNFGVSGWVLWCLVWCVGI